MCQKKQCLLGCFGVVVVVVEGAAGRGEEGGGSLIIWVKLFEQQGFTVDHPDGRHSRRATRAQVFRLLSNFFWEMPSNELPAGRFGPISL